ncbi:MAG: hypothetical protein ACE37J_17155 [Pikeienuella sp.]|uniref:hypothetical protein n=1 Tax=Pikeienuella sp. TaxID=2831957 RepID=UPI003919BD8C
MRRMAAILAALALSGCEAVPAFAPQPSAVAPPPVEAPAAAAPVLVESGAEPAPGAAFRISNLPAEWDGEATAGGLWVALPYLPAFERVLIRNPETGEAVVARLFWRDGAAKEAMLSSAAAEALGLPPGTAVIEAEVLE